MNFRGKKGQRIKLLTTSWGKRSAWRGKQITADSAK
jgi:hypothetical protein